MREKPSRYVALLRGVNVGGKNRVPMATLSKLVEAAGGQAVETYIQSGNALFSSTESVARRLGPALTKALADTLGLDVPVLVRSAAELAAIVAHGPYATDPLEPSKLFVHFLAEPPTPEAIASLDADRSPGDTFVVDGREVHLRLPNGAGRTKLTAAYFDARLRTTGTARNLRTVRELAERAARDVGRES